MLTVASIPIGPGHPLALIAGPCVLEQPDRVLRIAEGLAAIAREHRVPLIFKASFDKANRTALDSYRGPGLHEGLALLQRVRDATGLPLTTDVHLPEQAAAVGEVVDLVQIPAFLCRQTDLLVAAAATGRPVNVKKGQFVAPDAMVHAAEKCRRSGAPGVLITERGTTFGHGDLVVDLRGVDVLHDAGLPVCFDATHSVQRPGGRGASSGGDRRHVRTLSCAAVAAGVDAVFAEVHDDPASARSDSATQLDLATYSDLVGRWCALRAAG